LGSKKSDRATSSVPAVGRFAFDVFQLQVVVRCHDASVVMVRHSRFIVFIETRRESTIGKSRRNDTPFDIASAKIS
jgi:hypothetical protein